MLKRLNQEEKENIKGRYGEHPLYLMIRRTCKRFESRMPVFRLSPEEIFLRVSMIMDDIKESPEKTDNLYDTIWDDLYCEYRDLGNDIPPETELELGVCLVITVLACCLGRSKSLLSNYTIAKLMEQAHNHYPGASEILDLFIGYNDSDYNVWQSGYFDSDGYISDDFYDLLAPGKQQDEESETEETPENRLSINQLIILFTELMGVKLDASTNINQMARLIAMASGYKKGSIRTRLDIGIDYDKPQTIRDTQEIVALIEKFCPELAQRLKNNIDK